MRKNFLTLFISIFLLTLQTLNAANIGLCIMATGKYVSFIPPLIESADKHFCKNHNVTYFVFTEGYLEPREDLTVLYQAKIGWPFDTMMRFYIYSQHSDSLKNQDYLFACDADMLFVDEVGDEILGERVATIHPGYYASERSLFSYENNPNSKAFVHPWEGEKYFCGGFFGGSAKEFLKIAKKNSDNIFIDVSKGIIPRWHDESHWNRYCIDHKPSVVLSPSYCYTEGNVLPFIPRLIALNKNHAEMRKGFSEIEECE